MSLSQRTVVALKIDSLPVRDERGVVNYKPNPGRRPFVVYDSYQGSPVGFGIKVGARGKTYIVQRRVGGRVLKGRLGPINDYPSIVDARRAAREFAGVMTTQRKNPNAIRRAAEAARSEWGLGALMASYRSHLINRQDKPAADATLKVFDSAARHFADWDERDVSELKPQVILRRYDNELAKRKKRGQTALEQHYRWASSAVRHALRRAKHFGDATAASTYNPFEILQLERRFRSRATLETHYSRSGTRNPLRPGDGSLGRFLDATWAKRQTNRLGADYLLLTLLLGARHQETAQLQWHDRAAKDASWVDFERGVIRFAKTKNGTDHDLPLCHAARRILIERFDDRRSTDVYVFPARSSRRLRHARHYSDPKSVLAYIRSEGDIPVLRPHDLRRTFGALAEEHTSYAMAKRLLNHRDRRDTTLIYTDPSWERVRDDLQLMETKILAASAHVYNALLPATRFTRMAEQEGADGERRDEARQERASKRVQRAGR